MRLSVIGGASPVADRALVVLDGDMNLVACGVLRATAGELVTLGAYPGYDGGPSPKRCFHGLWLSSQRASWRSFFFSFFSDAAISFVLFHETPTFSPCGVPLSL